MTGRLPASGRTSLAWYQRRIRYAPDTLGINWPWQNVDGAEDTNYLTAYNSAALAADLSVIAGWGITTIRVWAPLESVMSWSGSAYSINPSNAANLSDLLTRCAGHGMKVILVIGDGDSSGGYSNLDGKFRWSFVTGPAAAYRQGLITYVSAFAAAYPNILMWELQNEPYGNLTWSPNAIASGATQAQLHSFLVTCYNTVKQLTSAYVGFSDYEEEQQARYQLFSSPSNRKALVDDCTDVYSMHIYRADDSQIADFRHLAGKPKWCTEIGCYNYYDPTASSHPIAAWDELLDDSGPNGFSGLYNPPSVRDIAAKLMNAGFTLIMPWAFGDNSGMVLHSPDGTYVTGQLPSWMASQFGSRSAASGRSPA